MHWDMEGVSGIFTREQVWFREEGVRKEIKEDGRGRVPAPHYETGSTPSPGRATAGAGG
jgi:hypothetical protein